MTGGLAVLTGPLGLLAGALAGAVAGVALGHLYFRSLRHSVDRMVEGRSGGRILALTLLRVALLGLGLLAVARMGAVALVAATGGILVARSRVLRQVEREAP
ncbi:MAG: ATP synthase subunit I [Gemmatimonadota bacterium]